ncbi:DNA-3-methyladenine glycosylase-like [Oncorhynchus nerka]|uniref:DNA-3-methyladenine glycosylase-like n=1 Tax=Oncorhynchus nerka TaxID=8023 RepID=UPI0031B89FE4
MSGRKRTQIRRGVPEPEGQVKRGVSLRKVRSTVHDHESSDVDDVRPGTVKSQYFSKEGEPQRLGEEFFNQPCINLAKAFLGKILIQQFVRRHLVYFKYFLIDRDWYWCVGVQMVVETEAYLGEEDKASHSAGGKCTARNTAMFMKPGTIYVYPIYGIYLCINVSSQGEGAAVLLRALEPLNGLRLMKQLRTARRREEARPLKDKELCNGPSKLCQALDIPRCFDRRDLASDPEVWLERDTQIGPQEPGLREVVSASRIGIDSHGEWATKPLRFYLRGHRCVSVVNKQAEIQIHSLANNVISDFASSSVDVCDGDTGQN